MTEHRCPGCNKLAAVTTDDFAGALGLFCQRCKAPFGDPLPLPRLDCECGKWLASGVVEAGGIRLMCRKSRALVEIGPSDVRTLEVRPAPVQKPRRLGDDDLVAMVEERWALLRADRAWGRAEVAAGLRFDVFNRDSFRCVYCGRGPSEGSLLEADHVMPRSVGGPDTLANLVTACRDCNRGKSAKLLDREEATA